MKSRIARAFGVSEGPITASICLRTSLLGILDRGGRVTAVVEHEVFDTDTIYLGGQQFGGVFLRDADGRARAGRRHQNADLYLGEGEGGGETARAQSRGRCIEASVDMASANSSLLPAEQLRPAMARATVSRSV